MEPKLESTKQSVPLKLHVPRSKNGDGRRSRNGRRLLERVADILEPRRYELSAVEVFEVGKPWSEADGDIREAIDLPLHLLRAQKRRLGRPKLTQQVSGEESYHHYWPRGVAFVIAPWNFPIAILCGMASAGIVTGNAVIMKPSEQSIVCGAMLMQVFEEAGVPPGVLNFLFGTRLRNRSAFGRSQGRRFNCVHGFA